MAVNGSGSALDADVVVVGAGPVGLTLANILGLRGVRTLVAEERDALIDYPRGVGLDDEALRTFQGIGLVDAVLPHTVPNQILRFFDGKRRLLAEMAPPDARFGCPDRNRVGADGDAAHSRDRGAVGRKLRGGGREAVGHQEWITAPGVHHHGSSGEVTGGCGTRDVGEGATDEFRGRSAAREQYDRALGRIICHEAAPCLPRGRWAEPAIPGIRR